MTTTLILHRGAVEVTRDELIAVTAKNGGHIGPNLGVVELTVPAA